jgi:hypothetical protein
VPRKLVYARNDSSDSRAAGAISKNFVSWSHA